MNRRVCMRTAVYIIIALVISAFAICISAESSYAVTNLRIRSRIVNHSNPTAVRCSWKSSMEGVKYYKITCQYGKKIIGTYKTKKANGSHIFRKLRKNRSYHFIISAYNKKNEYIKNRSWGSFTGVPAPYIDWEETESTGEFLSISFGGDAGEYMLKCMYVYKRVKGGTWKKVKTYKASGRGVMLLTYKDTKVKAGKTYQYRMRVKGTYRVKGKIKERMSPYSETVTLTAMNMRGRLSCAFSESTPKQKEMPVIDVDLTMDKYNYPVTLSMGSNNGAYIDNFVCEPAVTQYELTEFRPEGGEWQKADQTVTLKPGQKISLRFTLREGYPLVDFTEKRRIAIYCVSYNGESHYMMSMYPSDGKGFVYFQDEEWG